MRPKSRRTAQLDRRFLKHDVTGAIDVCTDQSGRTSGVERPVGGWIRVAVICGPALLAAVTFSNTLLNTFVYDDKWTAENVSRLSNAPLWFVLKSGRGLTYLLHFLDQSLWGSWEPGYRLTNIILHSMASSLSAVLTLLLTRSPRTALLCGFLFAVHPVHVEAVAVVAYRKDILAAIFVFSALIAWLWLQKPFLRYAITVGLLVVGFFAKEVAVIGAIPMFILADCIRQQRDIRVPLALRMRIIRASPLVLLAVFATAYFAGDITSYFSSDSIKSSTGLDSYNEVLASVALGIKELLRLLVFPVHLTADYSNRVGKVPSNPAIWQGMLVLVLWLGCGLCLMRWSPLMGFAALWPLITFIPCSNVVPLVHFLIAERYLYTPSFGVCLFVSSGLGLLAKHANHRSRKRVPLDVALCLILIVLGGARSFIRNGDWKSEATIWSAAIRDGGYNARAENNLGYALLESGRYDEALHHLEMALLANQRHKLLRTNIARILAKQGRFKEAEVHCRRILKDHPEDKSAELILQWISEREECSTRMGP